jgi:hypothetical protein
MGRFTAIASEATLVPSLLSRKKLKDWQKVPTNRPEARFGMGIFFPSSAWVKFMRRIGMDARLVE